MTMRFVFYCYVVVIREDGIISKIDTINREEKWFKLLLKQLNMDMSLSRNTQNESELGLSNHFICQ